MSRKLCSFHILNNMTANKKINFRNGIFFAIGYLIDIKNYFIKAKRKHKYNMKRNNNLSIKNGIFFEYKILYKKDLSKLLDSKLNNFDNFLISRNSKTFRLSYINCLKKLFPKYEIGCTKALINDLPEDTEIIFQEILKDDDLISSALVLGVKEKLYLYFLNPLKKNKVDSRISITQLAVYSLLKKYKDTKYKKLDLLVGNTNYKKVFSPEQYYLHIKFNKLIFVIREDIIILIKSFFVSLKYIIFKSV